MPCTPEVGGLCTHPGASWNVSRRAGTGGCITLQKGHGAGGPLCAHTTGLRGLEGCDHKGRRQDACRPVTPQGCDSRDSWRLAHSRLGGQKGQGRGECQPPSSEGTRSPAGQARSVKGSPHPETGQRGLCPHAASHCPHPPHCPSLLTLALCPLGQTVSSPPTGSLCTQVTARLRAAHSPPLNCFPAALPFSGIFHCKQKMRPEPPRCGSTASADQPALLSEKLLESGVKAGAKSTAQPLPASSSSGEIHQVGPPQPPRIPVSTKKFCSCFSSCAAVERTTPN